MVGRARGRAMPLFQIPGWSIPDEPVSAVSKKRKRDTSDTGSTVSLLSTAVTKIKGKANEGTSHKSDRKKAKRDLKELRGKEISRPRPLISTEKALPPIPSSSSPPRAPKKVKFQHEPESPVTSTVSLVHPSEGKPKTGSKLTSLQHRMKEGLDGARFR
jgi:ribosomal RNA-processing protein 8